jgi:conjugal transfer pilus assembly protein TraD
VNYLLQALDVGYTLWQYINKRSKKWGRRYFVAMFGILIGFAALLLYLTIINKTHLLVTVPYGWVSSIFSFAKGAQGIELLFSRLFTVVVMLIGYVLFLSFPSSVFFILLRRKVVDSRPGLRSPPKRNYYEHRFNAPKDAYFAGIDAENGEPVYVDDEARMEHTQIVGVTGAGKTEGGIVTALIHDIAWGRGAIVIDMKGDRSLLNKIIAAVIAAGRKDDLQFFSLAEHSKSNTYNPLRRGNASEIKDKIISSYIWSEVYYKKTSEIATLGICDALQKLNQPVTFQSLLECMRDMKKIEKMKRDLDAKSVTHDLESLLSALGGKTKDVTGLIADMTAIVGSDFGRLIEPYEGEIDLLEAYKNNKIVLFQLNTGLYQETAIRLARIIIQDIKTVSNHIQSYIDPTERHFYPVFIDEFASIAFEAFIELINKARSAKMAVSIAHQSLGDLKNAGEGFQNQIFDNTNTRIVFRQNSAESRDLITKMAGTVEKEKITSQTDVEYGIHMNTGRGSSRRVEKFQLDPNLITEFPTGYCALLQHKKSGVDRIRYVKSDYIQIASEATFLGDKISRPNEEEREMNISEIVEAVEKAPEMDELKGFMGMCG